MPLDLTYLRKKMDLQESKKFKITRSGLEINFSNGSKITVEHDEIDKEDLSRRSKWGVHSGESKIPEHGGYREDVEQEKES